MCGLERPSYFCYTVAMCKLSCLAVANTMAAAVAPGDKAALMELDEAVTNDTTRRNVK